MKQIGSYILNSTQGCARRKNCTRLCIFCESGYDPVKREFFRPYRSESDWVEKPMSWKERLKVRIEYIKKHGFKYKGANYGNG